MVSTLRSGSGPTTNWEADGGAPRRVRYVERMVLSAADLQTDDGYRVSAHRRHDLAGHDWGIVLGLALVSGASANASIVRLQPGVAVDGLGRDIVVTETVDLDVRTLAESATNAFDVWLLYGRQPDESPHAGRWDCGPGQNDRWREEPLVWLTPATSSPDPWALVPDSALDVTPGQELSDGSDPDWPVFLGRLDTQGQVDPTGRLYASLRGEIVRASSGTARLVLGSDAADPNVRFVIAVQDPAGAFVDRLAVDRDGNAQIVGEMRVTDHDLTLTMSRDGDGPVARCEPEPDLEAVEAQRSLPAIVFPVPTATPAAASPWNVYRSPAIERDRPTLDQMTFETGAPDGTEDPARYRLAIGRQDDDTGGFEPCLTVDAACTVRIMGSLEVTGKLSYGPVHADPADKTFVDAMADAWLTGFNAARAARNNAGEIS